MVEVSDRSQSAAACVPLRGRNPATPGDVRDAASGDEGGSEALVGAGQIGEGRTVAVSDTRASRATALRAASPARRRCSASAGREASGLRSAQARRMGRRWSPVRCAARRRIGTLRLCLFFHFLETGEKDKGVVEAPLTEELADGFAR